MLQSASRKRAGYVLDVHPDALDGLRPMAHARSGWGRAIDDPARPHFCRRSLRAMLQARWQIVDSPLGVGAGRAGSWRRRADEF